MQCTGVGRNKLLKELILKVSKVLILRPMAMQLILGVGKDDQQRVKPQGYGW